MLQNGFDRTSNFPTPNPNGKRPSGYNHADPQFRASVNGGVESGGSLRSTKSRRRNASSRNSAPKSSERRKTDELVFVDYSSEGRPVIYQNGASTFANTLKKVVRVAWERTWDF
jgi:hypothetical protein